MLLDAGTNYSSLAHGNDVSYRANNAVGGGTVDANTYTVSTGTPLRLTREVVPPGGKHPSNFTAMHRQG